MLIYLSDHTYGVQIGNDSEHDPATDNEFHHLGIGVRSLNSDATVQNCTFRDIDYDPGDLDYPASAPINETLNKCFGVAATGEVLTLPPFLLELGFAISDDPNKLFEDVRNAVYCEEYVNSEIHRNRIVSIPSGLEYVMDNAIILAHYDETNILHNVMDNYIAYFMEHGLYCWNADDGEFNVETNTFQTSLSIEVGLYAIRVDGNTGTDVNIYDNTILTARTGIFVENTPEVDIIHNTVEFYSPTSSDVSYGIRIDNCEDAYIFENQVTGNYDTGFGDKVRCSYIESSAGFIADENLVEDGSAGFYLNEPSVTGTLTCNAIEYNAVGIAMREIAALSGSEYGIAVHKARGLLDTVLHTTDEYWPEERNSLISSPEIVIYPNPAANYLTVELNNPEAGYFITFSDLLGNVLFHRAFQTTSEIINIESVPGGIYFMSVSMNGHVVSVQKIVILR